MPEPTDDAEQHRLHVLLVEDNPADVELTRFAFEDAGLDVELEVVSDGDEALAFLRGLPPFAGGRRPSVVLLDLRLPRVDGPEVLAAVRADPELARIPVVLLSADDEGAAALQGAPGGADGYLSKPVEPEGLRGLLCRLVPT